jgi:tRNA (cmo5U34)-methyltransferase
VTDSSGHMPEGRWSFDAAVTECFDDMLARSIPDLAGMRGLVHDVVVRSASGVASPVIVDLGTSRGGALASLRRALPTARMVGVETSPPMLDAARSVFADDDLTDVVDLDLRSSYPDVSADVTLSVLALQFIPIEYRLRIVRDVFKHTRPGGLFVLVEKVLGGSADIDSMMVDLYLSMKQRAGYSRESVDRKRHALEGVLVPVTARWNEELLHLSGFREVDCFWRCLNFAGWVAVR